MRGGSGQKYWWMRLKRKGWNSQYEISAKNWWKQFECWGAKVLFKKLEFEQKVWVEG